MQYTVREEQTRLQDHAAYGEGGKTRQRHHAEYGEEEKRGGGITLACGSGASAVGVAAQRAGLSGRVNEIVMDGGKVIIDWQDDGTESGRVIMQGPVADVFRGQLSDALDQCLRAV